MKIIAVQNRMISNCTAETAMSSNIPHQQETGSPHPKSEIPSFEMLEASRIIRYRHIAIFVVTLYYNGCLRLFEDPKLEKGEDVTELRGRLSYPS